MYFELITLINYQPLPVVIKDFESIDIQHSNDCIFADICDSAGLWINGFVGFTNDPGEHSVVHRLQHQQHFLLCH